MSPWTTLPGLGLAGLGCDRVHLCPGQIIVEAHTVAASACCPACGQPSGRVHSRYRRVLADLPWQGTPVRLVLTARRFFCDHPECPRNVFTEPLAGLADKHARRSQRLRQGQSAIGLALGGEAVARLAGRLGMPTSGDSLLRMMHHLVPPAAKGKRGEKGTSTF